MLDGLPKEREFSARGLEYGGGWAGSRFHEWLEVRPFLALLPTVTEYSVNAVLPRSLIPSMFADAVQEALIEAGRVWSSVAGLSRAA